ncbi:MAG: hypothetical protein J6C19_05015 [Lachnospiraceae bacterium]|nr:hypothetical protein [Lachnospiraceae bacterium]
MSRKNIIEAVNGMTDKINPHYDMRVMDLRKIIEEYAQDPIELVSCSFRYGYMQGMKAVRTEMKTPLC